MKTEPCALLAIFFSICLIIVASACSGGAVKNEQQLQSVTAEMQKQVQARLNDLDGTLTAAAVKIAGSSLTSSETRQVLEDMCEKYPYIVDCATQDNKGTMVALAPESCRQYEGINTSKNEVSTEFLVNKDPLLSNLFKAVQGFDALVLVRPVVSEKGEVMGSVSALFKPEPFLDDIIAPLARSAGIKVNVIQTDGMAMYCTTGTETGKNVLTDPSYKQYPELVKQGARFVAEKTGTASYMFPSVKTGQPVKKTVFWNSVGLHGTEYRIIAIAEFGD